MAPIFTGRWFGFGASSGSSVNYVPDNITVFQASSGAYVFPSPFQNARSVTTVVFGGHGKGGNSGAGAFNGAGGGGSGAFNYNYPLPTPQATLDLLQNGITFEFNGSNDPGNPAPYNRVRRTNDSSTLFQLGNGYNGVSDGGPGGVGGPAPISSPGSTAGATGGAGGGRDGSGAPGNSGSGGAGAGGGGFGRGNNQNAGSGASGGTSSGPYTSYPKWTISAASPPWGAPGPGSTSGTPANQELGGSGGPGQPIIVTGAPIPTPGYFGGGGGGAGQWAGAFGGRDGFFIVYIEAEVPE